MKKSRISCFVPLKVRTDYVERTLLRLLFVALKDSSSLAILSPLLSLNVHVEALRCGTVTLCCTLLEILERTVKIWVLEQINCNKNVSIYLNNCQQVLLVAACRNSTPCRSCSATLTTFATTQVVTIILTGFQRQSPCQ